MFNWGSNQIEACEKSAVAEAIVSSKIPHPSGDEWNAIVSHYGLPERVVVDKVLSSVVFPKGWTCAPDPSDYYSRNVLIKDHEGKKVGSYFLKNTGYDYYGNTSFDRTRLVELGVMKDNIANVVNVTNIVNKP